MVLPPRLLDLGGRCSAHDASGQHWQTALFVLLELQASSDVSFFPLGKLETDKGRRGGEEEALGRRTLR
eukprot:scaffold5445_cov105-Pinguiococcus_pyrenoidosus.AAC.1